MDDINREYGSIRQHIKYIILFSQKKKVWNYNLFNEKKTNEINLK